MKWLNRTAHGSLGLLPTTTQEEEGCSSRMVAGILYSSAVSHGV